MTRKPAVCYITSRMPAPPLSGGQLREYNMLKRLGGSFDVHLWVATALPEICRTGIQEMSDFCQSVHLYETDAPADRPKDVPMRVWRQRNTNMVIDIADSLRTDGIDLVHVEGYYMMQFLPRDLELPIILIEQNVEYLIDRQWEVLGGEAAVPAESEVAKKLEIAQWRRAMAFGVVSEDDKRHIQDLKLGFDPLYVPHGCDHLRVLDPGATRGTQPTSPHGSVVFVGDYTYPPTHDGAVFLLREIWPSVVNQIRDARLSIVGRGPSEKIKSLAAGLPGVEVTGVVESLTDVLDQADVFVCPLRVGGGVKLKMLEAVARGVPTVTTPVGAQGLPKPITAEMIVASDPKRLATSIIELLRNDTARRRHSVALRKAAGELPTWEKAAATLRNAWTELAAGHRASGPHARERSTR